MDKENIDETNINSNLDINKKQKKMKKKISK